MDASEIYGVDGDYATTSVTTQETGYIAGKIQEFQNVLYAVDETAASLQAIIAADVDQMLSEDDYQRILALLADYDTRREAFRLVAEGYNAAVSAANAMGLSLPTVSVPSTLGFAPLAFAAAIAAGAALVTWAYDWMGETEATASEIAAKIADPAKRDATLAEVARIQAARQTSGGTIGSIATIAKYGALGLLGFFAFRAFMDSRKG